MRRKYQSKILILFYIGAALLQLGLPLCAQVPAEDASPPSAWDVLLQQDPSSLLDKALPVDERRILQALTPDQAERYAQGAEADTIVLPNGENLAEFIERQEETTAAGLVYKPLGAPCTVLDTRRIGAKLGANETRALKLRGQETDYSEQGGSARGCGIPSLRGESLKTNTARALFLNVAVFDAEGAGELSLWPSSNLKGPEVGLLSYADAPHLIGFRNSVTVAMCDEESLDPCVEGDLKLSARDSGAHVAISVLGFFENGYGVARAEAADGDKKSLTSPFWEQNDANIFYNDGDVGIGTDSPDVPLHISQSNGTAQIVVEENSGTQANRNLIELVNNGGVRTVFTDTSTGESWALAAEFNGFRVINLTSAFVGLGVNPAGNVVLGGSLGVGLSSHETPSEGIEVKNGSLHLSRASGAFPGQWSMDRDLNTGRLTWATTTPTGAAIVPIEVAPDASNKSLVIDGALPEGGVRVGLGTEAPAANLHVSGQAGSAGLLIEADTDNVGESDQPNITLSQDGGLVTGQLGYFNSRNDLSLVNRKGPDAKVVLKSNGDVCIGSGC